MSDVPGSEKVTRWVSKPAAFSRFSRTPSAPASAGVTDGQRTRSRAMETASFMPPLNMRCGRWASTVRHKFQLGLLVPARPGVARRQRVWAEPVRRFCASQAEQFDKAPDAQTESEGAGQTRQNRVLQPVRELVEQARRNEERDKPPAALVAIVQPLDRGGRETPREEDGHRNDDDLREQRSFAGEPD